MERRVAITGIGAVTPLGVGAGTMFDRWVAGESGLEGPTGLCREFEPQAWLSVKELRRTDRFAQLGMAAATEAAQQAGWSEGLPAERERIGCVIGTGFGGLATIAAQTETFRVEGERGIPPVAIAAMMSNAAPGMVCIRFGLRGPAHSVGSACAAGADAIGMAAGLIKQGRTDAMIAGGADAATIALASAATARAGALSKSGISRPFDARRDGFVLSEGAGALVLEELTIARSRGARILAELAGYGASCDAFHLTAPDPSAKMPARAIAAALEDAGAQPGEVDYVNAHGTGTVLNDRMETLALKSALGSRSMSVPVSSLKSAIGHVCGAAGAVEAVASVESIRSATAAPTLNYAVPEQDLDLDYVTHGSIPLHAHGERPLTVLSNSFGFGGHNAVLCLRGLD